MAQLSARNIPCVIQCNTGISFGEKNMVKYKYYAYSQNTSGFYYRGACCRYISSWYFSIPVRLCLWCVARKRGADRTKE